MLEKIFKAYDVRATYPDMINEDAAYKVGYATAEFLKKAGTKVGKQDTIVIGRDARPSSPSLAKALADGIRAAGLNVIDVGMIDTSFIYFAINQLGTVGGIMVTASHNPVKYNGLKISGPLAKPIGSASGLNDIKAIAVAMSDKRENPKGAYEEQDLWAGYKKHVLSFLELKKPIDIWVDASNGMAGVMVPKVFEGVPNLQIRKLLFEVTGEFVHEPNPLVESNLHELKEHQAKHKAHLGACFDGDADRCMFIDENSKTIPCDLLTALLAEDFLSVPKNKGSAVVYDLRSSHIVPETIKANGGEAVRDRVGHAFIKKTMSEKKAVFGGELSGHFYFRDNFFADSGAIAFARLLTVLSHSDKPLSQLISKYEKYAQSGEINFQVEDKDGAIAKLKKKYSSGKTDELDGVTVELSDWWFNVRKSNTEPLLRLNLEAKNDAEMKAKVQELQEILGQPAEGH